MDETSLMLHTLLTAGESMLANGGEIRIVEDTLKRMGRAYGAVRMDVFVITSSIVVSMCFPDGTAATQSRRIEKPIITDFGKLEDINSLSRRYCASPFPVEELADELHRIKHRPGNNLQYLAGNVIGAAAFTLFFGGGPFDALAAAVFALVVFLLQQYLPLILKNRVVFNFLTAFIVGMLIAMSCRIFPALHADKVIIGDIMLLIPGLHFTNAVKNIFAGDTISGVMRLIETVLWASALALGFVLSGAVFGGGAI